MTIKTGLPISGRGPAIITVGDNVYPLTVPAEVMFTQTKTHTPVNNWAGQPVENYQGESSYSVTVSAMDVPRELIADLLGQVSASSAATRSVVSVLSSVSTSDRTTIQTLLSSGLSPDATAGFYILSIGTSGTITAATPENKVIPLSGAGGIYTSSKTSTVTPSSGTLEVYLQILSANKTPTTIAGGRTGERCQYCQIAISSDNTQDGQYVETTIHRCLLNSNEMKSGDETTPNELTFTAFQDPTTGDVYTQTAAQ